MEARLIDRHGNVQQKTFFGNRERRESWLFPDSNEKIRAPVVCLRLFGDFFLVEGAGVKRLDGVRTVCQFDDIYAFNFNGLFESEIDDEQPVYSDRGPVCIGCIFSVKRLTCRGIFVIFIDHPSYVDGAISSDVRNS